MAEPARELDPYDDEGTEQAPARPDLRALEGGNPGGSPRPAQNPFHAVRPDETAADDSKGPVSDRPNLQVLDGGKSETAASPSELAGEESAAGGQLGAGYSGDDEDTGIGSKLKGAFSLKGKSRLKKGIAAGSVIAAGGGTAGILGFLSLVPLKITSIVTNLQNTYSSTSVSALDGENKRLFNGYIAKHVLPDMLNSKVCQSTVDATCVANINGTNPVSKLYQAWHQKHLETKLAKDYNIIIGKKGGQLYMTVDGVDYGNDAELRDVMNGKKSIFDLDVNARESVSATAIRQKIDVHLKDATLWDKSYFRFKYGKLLESKYGIKLCVIACDYYDKFKYPLKDKLNIAKSTIILRTLSPVSETYGIVMTCLVSDDNFCKTALEPMSPQDEERLSPFQRQLRQTLLDYAAKYPDKLDDLMKLVKDSSGKSITQIATKAIVQTMVSSFTDNSGEAAGEVSSKAIPVIGWIFLAAKIIHSADTIGPKLRVMAYAVTAAAAVSLYATYNTVSSETKSGHMDPTELESFANVLSSNVTGTNGDSSDASQPPLYNKLYGQYPQGSTSTAFVSGLFGDKAYADASSQAYTCNNGQPVPAGQLVCPEEKLDQGNDIASSIHDLVNIVPAISGISGFINDISNVFNSVLSAPITQFVDFECNVVGQPECPAAEAQVAQKSDQLFSWLINQLVPSPFSGNMSGGRTFDMMAAGADVSYNKSCQVELGCSELSNQQVADIRNQQTDEQKADFDSQSMFARMFSTDTPYSLVSRLAVAMPTNILVASSNSFASIMSNPFGNLLGGFSDILSSSDNAFAATPAQSDPFGVVQYGYTQAELDSIGDPETYWQNNCQGDFTTAWESSQNQDPDTGEPLATTPEPCLLIQASVQSAGAIFDSSLMPSGSGTPDPPPQPPATQGQATQ